MDPLGKQSSNRSKKKVAYDMGLDMQSLEESTQWANLAENCVDILKGAIRQDFFKSNVPLVVWKFCAE